jgi:iron complex outermembrane receptor protein
MTQHRFAPLLRLSPSIARIVHSGRSALAALLAGGVLSAPFAPAAATPSSATWPAAGDEVVQLEKFSVEAQRLQETFRLENATSATLLSADLRDLPLNIAVLPADVIHAQAITDLKGALTRLAGINTRGGHVRTFGSFVGRGFPIDGERSGYLKNGIPFFGVDAPAADVAHLDRIEYLRGASALLYGAGEPGGAINYVYRAPSPHAAYAAEVTFGTDDIVRGEADATGPLGTPTLLYRASLGWENSQGWIDYDYTEKFAPALQLAWQPTAATRVHLLGEFTRLDTNPIAADTYLSRGTRGSIVRLPKERYLGHTNDYSEERSDALQLTATHAFSAEWSALLQLGLSGVEREQGNTGYFSSVNPNGLPASGLLNRLVFDQRRTTEGRYGAAHLNWQGETGPLRHNALIGVNASEGDMHNINGFSSSIAALASAFATPVTPIDPFAPTHTAYPHLRNFGDSPPFSPLEWTYVNQGVNVQDLIHLPAARLHVLLGGRFSRYELEVHRSQNHAGVNTLATSFRPLTNEKFIPRAGIVWEFAENTSVFASYSESFVGPFSAARGPGGALLDEPEIGVQYEAGLRRTMLGDRVAVSLALYDLTKENVIVGTAVPNVSIQDGEQRSRGVEFDFSGAVVTGWNV